jgi:hypothetical protein
VVVRSARSARATASQRRARAEGMFCPLCDFVFVSILLLASEECCPAVCRVRDGFNESVKNCEALAKAVEQKEADRVAMSEAISAFCQAFGLDGVPSGSSPQSHLWALGGHVRNRLRGALHHGVRRAFAVLASHYDVDLGWVSEGYCLPDEEEAALVGSRGLTRLSRARVWRWLPPLRWRLSMQKSPKGAAGLAQQVQKIVVFREDYPCRSRLRVQPD